MAKNKPLSQTPQKDWPQSMTVNALSVETGREHRTINKILKHVPKTAEGGYDPRVVIPMLTAMDGGKEDLRVAEARFKTAKADKAETEMAIMKGKLVYRDEVKRTAAQMVTAVQRKILAIPNTLAARVQHKLGLTAEQAQVLQMECDLISRDICQQMARKEWE